MATGPGSPAPQPYPQKPAPSDANVYGIIGLVCGLLGFFTTVTAPIGLVLSYMGLKHPQNGIAIAGLIISIISTLYAAIMVAIMVLWFGAIAAMCGGGAFCMGMASDEMALQSAVRRNVAEELEMQSYEVTVDNFSSDPPFGGDAKTFTGRAVYTDEQGQYWAVDFSGDARKVESEWKINNLTIDSEPYEWSDPLADGQFDDGAAFDSSDASGDEAFDAPADGISDGVFDDSMEEVDSESADSLPAFPKPGDGEAAIEGEQGALAP